jgi:hypothetical protein
MRSLQPALRLELARSYIETESAQALRTIDRAELREKELGLNTQSLTVPASEDFPLRLAEPLQIREVFRKSFRSCGHVKKRERTRAKSRKRRNKGPWTPLNP